MCGHIIRSLGMFQVSNVVSFLAQCFFTDCTEPRGERLPHKKDGATIPTFYGIKKRFWHSLGC